MFGLSVYAGWILADCAFLFCNRRSLVHYEEEIDILVSFLYIHSVYPSRWRWDAGKHLDTSHGSCLYCRVSLVGPDEF